MGRTIVPVQGADRQRDLRTLEGIGLRVGTLEGIDREGLRGAIIPGETGRRGIQAGIVRVETLGVILEEMREIDPEGIRLEILEETGRVAIRGIVREGILEGIRPVIREGVGRVAILGGMQAEVGLQGIRERGVLPPITHGLRGIRMQDFRSREVATGHRRNNGLRDNRRRGHSHNLSSGLSQDRRRRVHDRVGLAGITMPEQRGRRVIGVEPVRVVVAETGEVEADETSQS
jgi:hypothetical protein